MSTTQERAHESTGKLESALKDLVETARDQGGLWARHGLTIGRAALETNARALQSVAGLLGRLAEGFEAKPGREASGPTESAPREGEAPST